MTLMAGLTRGNDPARMLNRRYLASFGALAFLLLLNQLLVQPQLLNLAVDPPTINRAGRQRMLSQRLAKAALAAVRDGDDADRRHYLEELAGVRVAWSASHTLLRSGQGGSPASSTGFSEAIRAGLKDVEPSFVRLQDASARLIGAYSANGRDPAAAEAAIAAILREEGKFLRQMDRVVGLYEGEARARVDRLLWTGRMLTALSLVVLAGLGLVVLRPASGIIRRQVEDLRRARDELELKVRERTRALEEEAERRSYAEARHRAVLEMAGHAARVNTLGEMASSLAHELNQPLGAIANYAEGCLVELGRDSPDLQGLRAAHGKILANAFRAGEVIKRIRRFVTRRTLEREPLDPRRLLLDVADLMRDEAARRRIDLQIEAASDLPWVMGDPVQIQQVLINLVRNAYEAIEASQTSIREVLLTASAINSSLVNFLVTDHGEGIPSERLAGIFEAYFSTRAEGMGMGLAISRTIIEAHEGTLTAESEPGLATTFRFTLPSTDAGNDDGRHGLRR